MVRTRASAKSLANQRPHVASAYRGEAGSLAPASRYGCGDFFTPAKPRQNGKTLLRAKRPLQSPTEPRVTGSPVAANPQ